MRNKKFLFYFAFAGICLLRAMVAFVFTYKNSLFVKPLSDKDFAVTDGVDYIYLDCSADKFSKTMKKKEIKSSYVGEIFLKNDKIYKSYLDEYKDIDVYISNVLYHKKGLNFDNYRVVQIDSKTPRLQTTNRNLKKQIAN